MKRVLPFVVAVLWACTDSPATVETITTPGTTLPTTTATTLPTTTAPSSATSTISTTTTTTTGQQLLVIEVEVEDGVSSTGGQVIEARVGQQVAIRVEADQSDEVHLHGYDLSVEVAPDSPGELSFVADIPGVFEVELEGSRILLFELSVSP